MTVAMRFSGAGVLCLLLMLPGCRRHETVELPFGIGVRPFMLSGTVSDAVTRAPLAGARVLASTFAATATSGADGGYVLALEVGGVVSQLQVVVERSGYITRAITVSTSTTRLDIELQPAAQSLP